MEGQRTIASRVVPRTARKAWLVVACAAACLSSGCSSSNPPAADASSASSSVQTQTVSAERRRITSVLVLDATVVSHPYIRISSPRTGTLTTLKLGRIGIVGPDTKNVAPVQLPPSTSVMSLLVPPGTRVTTGSPIADAQYAGFAVEAKVDPSVMYRLYSGIRSARAEIVKGPGPFNATILGSPFPPGAITPPPVENTSSPGNEASASAETSPGSQAAAAVGSRESTETSSFPVVAPVSPTYDLAAGVVIIAGTPSDLRLFEGMPALLAVTTAEKMAVALPVEAVAGISDHGQVYVVEKGVESVRDVKLGITDGTYVEIANGLKAGDSVRVPPPTIESLK